MLKQTLRKPTALDRATQLSQALRRRSFVQLINHYLRQDLVRLPVFLLLHVGLGLALVKAPWLSTAHAGLVVALGLWWTLATARLERAAYLAAYISGAEALWRMTGATLPWEFSKYAVSVILFLALLRSGKLEGGLLPILFFILLLPALVLPMANVTFESLSDQARFYLSGPLALTVAAWFFTQVKLNTAQLQRLLLALLGPIAGVATVTLYGIITAPELIFVDDSNPLLSGGFGPNQVSAVLGVGAVCCLLWAMDGTVGFALRCMLATLALYFLGQSALTFSRGGVYMAVGSIGITTLFLIRERRTRIRAILALGLLFMLANFVLLPRLDSFTQGALTKRFSDTQTTGRTDLAWADIQVFLENPIFGVGPGQTRQYRSPKTPNSKAASHTEFTRLLSEHGLFGLLALLVLVTLAAQHFLHARTPLNRALTCATLVWAILFLASNAMRLVLPSFLFGLSAVTLTKMTAHSGTPPSNSPTA